MSLKLRVGARLRDIRNERGLTQERLAELIDRSVDAVSAIERGRALPSFETLEKLADRLEVPIRDFFDVEQDATDERAKLLARLVISARSLDDEGLRLATELVAVLTKGRLRQAET